MCSSSSRRACKASSVDTPFSSRPRDFTSFARALDAATTSSRGFMSCCFSRSSSFTSLSWSRTGTIASRASSRLSFASLSVSMASSMIFVSATTRASLRSISASCSSSAGGAGTRTIHSWRLGKAREALSNEAVVTSASSLTPPRPPREKDVANPGFISEPDLGPDLGRLGDLEGAGEDASSGPWPGRSTAPGERDAPLSFLETRVSLSPLCGCLASGLSKPGGADIRGAFVAALAIFALCEEAASSIARISTWGLTPSSSIWRPDPMRTRCSCEVTGIRGVSAPRGRDEARAEKTVSNTPRGVPSRFPMPSTRIVRAYRTSRGTEIARARVAEESNGHYEAGDAPPVPTRAVECARRGLALDSLRAPSEAAGRC